MRLPRLLRMENGEIREAGRLTPCALSAEMNLLPLSRAEMTLRADEMPVRVRDLVEISGQNGALGIFRVTAIEDVCGRQRRLRLNHALDTLADALIPDGEEWSGTVAQALERALAAQPGNAAFWRLGAVEDAAQWHDDGRAANALQCLTALAEREDGYYFAFDFGAFPWTLSFLRRPEGTACEFRLPRNVESCRVSLDEGSLCTRLYLTVESAVTDGTGERTAVTHEVYDDAAGQAAWGVVSRAAAVSARETPDRAAWAARYFARHGQPEVRITVDGRELNRLTGESLDEMRPGALCRVALPEEGRTFIERVLAVAYPDLTGQPERVRVTLANRTADLGASVARLAARAGTAERTLRENTREIRENRYSLRAADRHITDMGEILHAAGLEIDAHGVWLYATEEGENSALGASFKVQQERIEGVVEKTGIESLAEGETLVSRVSAIRQTADSITLEITEARGGQSTLAGNINLRARTTTVEGLETNINSALTTISSLRAGSSTFSLVNTQAIRLAGYSLYLGPDGMVKYGSGD